jgi:5-methylcytosine-specific restriction protein B
MPEAPAASSIKAAIEAVLGEYAAARTQNYRGDQPIVATLTRLGHLLKRSPVVLAHPRIHVVWSVGRGGWAHVPWVSLMDNRETSTAQNGVYVVFLFRVDMSGVYLALNQGLAVPKKKLQLRPAREALRRRAEAVRPRIEDLAAEGFALDSGVDLRRKGPSRLNFASSIIAHRLYERGAIPPDQEILGALSALLGAYETYLQAPLKLDGVAPLPLPSPAPLPPFEPLSAVRELIAAIAERGFSFEPWQIAAYVTALRTKPFVILAGVSGTGKSKLPALVAEVTGGQATLLPVRPDWTDSADVLGYVDLREQFRPGALLRLARAAAAEPDRYHVCIIDEMNLARVEQYFAEVLSRIEDRAEEPAGGFASGPLLAERLAADDDAWAAQGLPPNLAVVGTVNMDETTHGFSRKVLDRAFTLEISDIDLHRWQQARPSPPRPAPWPVTAFRPRALRLGALRVTDADRAVIDRVIEVLSALNQLLGCAQLQVGYRVRDEIALFVLHAREIAAAFVTHTQAPQDPLDLALEMKILPRIAGGSSSVRAVVREMLGFVHLGKPFARDEDADALLTSWKSNDRPAALAGAHYPRTAARLALMWDRLLVEGYTSYWL